MRIFLDWKKQLKIRNFFEHEEEDYYKLGKVIIISKIM